MKKISLILSFLITIILFSACNNNKPSKTNKEENKKDIILGSVDYSKFKIGNRDKKYFKMVDNGKTDIKINKRGDIEVTAEFEVVKTFKKKLGNYDSEQAFVSLIALDENNNPIKLSIVSNGEMRPSNDSDGSQFADFLRGDPGYRAKFIFTGGIYKTGFETDRKATIEAGKKIKGFKVLTDGLNY